MAQSLLDPGSDVILPKLKRTFLAYFRKKGGECSPVRLRLLAIARTVSLSYAHVLCWLTVEGEEGRSECGTREDWSGGIGGCIVAARARGLLCGLWAGVRPATSEIYGFHCIYSAEEYDPVSAW